jgi:hypothetical protein
MYLIQYNFNIYVFLAMCQKFGKVHVILFTNTYDDILYQKYIILIKVLPVGRFCRPKHVAEVATTLHTVINM